jgi:CBS domain-containing protein
MMGRYRHEQEPDRDRRDYEQREERYRREALGSYDEPYSSLNRDYDRPRDDRGSRFGERAEYEHNEPRYSDPRERIREQNRRNTLYDIRGDLSSRASREYYRADRSRLRCRDVMTRDLVVATRDTTLREVALMMKQEDTGVIPVVDYDVPTGNGKTEQERNYDGRNHSRGKLVGLITDRDIAIRAVSEGKDCTTTRAEEVMSTDLHTERPNDRVVEVIRKMGNKQVRRIPVVNESGYLMGMISMADIANETQEDRELSEAFEDISKGSTFWGKLFGSGW